MKKLIVAAALVAGTVMAADPMKAEPMKPMMQKSYIVPADLKWEQPFGPQGPSIVIVQGDPKTGPYTMFMKFTAGTDSGWHTHDHSYVATVVKGTMTAQAQGDAAETKLPVGSFFSEPGKKNHRNTCTKDSECIIFGHSMGPQSTTMMSPDGKPLPPPAAPKAEMKKK